MVSILPWACKCEDVKRMKQRWATRCQKCIKHQLLCTARCALRRKKTRGKPLKLCTLPSLPHMLPKHSRIVLLVDAPEVEQVGTWGSNRFTVDACALHGIKVLGTTISTWQISIREWQRSARPVGARRSGHGSCGRWCKALARAGLRAKQLRRLHALRRPWQPVSKRQLSEAPKLQWLQRPEGWTEHRGTGTSQQSASAPFLFLRKQRRQPKPVVPPHRESPAAKGPWRPSQTQ